MRDPALHAAVLAAPDEDGPRLVYADWLCVRGDPRGELIRVQIARARLATDTESAAAIEQELFANHEAVWRQPFKTSLIAWSRGFVESVRTQWLTELNAVALADACVRSLAITDHQSKEIAAHVRPLLPMMRLRELRIDSPTLPLASFAALVGDPGLAGLRLFALDGKALTREHIHAMLESPQLAAVDALHVSEISEVTLRELARWPRPLRELSIRYARLVEGDLAALLDRDAFAMLRVLDLCRTGIARRDLHALLDSRIPLADLGLHQCNIDADDARAIARTPRFASLERLDVGHTQIGVAGLDALCESPYLPRDMVLNIDGDVLGLRPSYDFDPYGGRAFGGGWEGPILDRWNTRFKIRLVGTSM